MDHISESIVLVLAFCGLIFAFEVVAPPLFKMLGTLADRLFGKKKEADEETQQVPLPNTFTFPPYMQRAYAAELQQVYRERYELLQQFYKRDKDFYAGLAWRDMKVGETVVIKPRRPEAWAIATDPETGQAFIAVLRADGVVCGGKAIRKGIPGETPTDLVNRLACEWFEEGEGAI